MTQRYVKQVDATTGEQLEQGLLVYVPNRPRIKGGWFMSFQDGLIKLAEDRTMTARQYRVLLHLMGRLDFENFIHVPQVDVAKALKLAPSHVSEAMRALLQKGILIEGPKVGRIRTLRLSDTLGWKGRVRSLQDERKRRLTLAHSATSSADSALRAQLEKRGQRRLDE